MPTYKPTKGELLELRLARLLFAEGAFVRRSVDLRAEFGTDFTVTDLDVLSVRFNADLSMHRSIGECKSGVARSAAKASDRLLWGRGLRELIRADSHIVVTTRKIDAEVRLLAERLGGEVLDERDLQRRERLLKLDSTVDYGSHDPALLSTVRDYYATLRRDDGLKRAWRFALSDGWLMEPVAAIKRSLGASQLLSRHHGQDTTDAELRAIEWLLWQSGLVFSVALVQLAGEAYRRPPELFEPWFMERMAGGRVPTEEMERISRDVDEYIVALLAKLGASPAQQVGALGALAPEPPHYAEPLLEVVRRLAGEPAATAALPRMLDWRIAEYALGRQLDPAPDHEDASRLLRMVAAFLRGQARIPAHLLGPFVAPFDDGHNGPAARPDSANMKANQAARLDVVPTADTNRETAKAKDKRADGGPRSSATASSEASALPAAPSLADRRLFGNTG